MGEVIDLDKIAAARREAEGEQPVVKFGGQEFKLPSEMPFAVIEAVGRLSSGTEEERNAAIAESMGDIARSLFGADYKRFLGLGPSMQDITALLEAVPAAYATEEDEGGGTGEIVKEPAPITPLEGVERLPR